jgi:hypothetical protein
MEERMDLKQCCHPLKRWQHWHTKKKRQPMAVGCLCSHVSTLTVDQAKKMDTLNRHCHEGIYCPP